jgi:hypothetical protein
MPLYRFVIHKSRGGADSESIEALTDDKAALEEASKIIHDLTKNNQQVEWVIEVTERSRQVCEISFHGAN